jgi:glycogen synthase
MKVLMLGWELPPNNSGGLGVACLQLSKALAKAGADINFILPYKHSERYEFMEVTSVTDIPAGSIYLNGAYDSFKYVLSDDSAVSLNVHDQQLYYAYMVSALAEKQDFDIIHAHDWLTFRAALFAKQKRNRPVVLHVHSIERDRSGGLHGNPFVREIEEISMLMADHVFAVSEMTRQSIISEYNIPPDKVEVAHNSVDVAFWEPLEPENSYKYLADLKKQGWRIVANVGRLTIQKGLPHLLDAAVKVLAKQPRTIFLFVGDGEQRDELIEMAAERNIGKNIVFAGFQRGKRWRDSYAIADVFVMPSVSEPFGLTPIEAAGYGTPSLISKQSGVSEMFSNCLKVDYWDIDLMADKLIGALRSQPLLDELGHNAQQEFLSLSWNKTADKIFSRYQQIRSEVPA